MVAIGSPSLSRALSNWDNRRCTLLDSQYGSWVTYTMGQWVNGSRVSDPVVSLIKLFAITFDSFLREML